MKILVTGATGFIGRALVEQLLSRGDQVYAWLHKSQLEDKRVTPLLSLDQCPEVDAVINLAGAPIADRRWTEGRKRLLMDSRVAPTQSLISWIETQRHKPEVLISGSAVGFYGAATLDKPVTENSEAVLTDFSHNLCATWEDAALQAERQGVRVVVIRTGIVLGAGGALARMRLPFSLGVGGPIAGGEQWMSWIHLNDQVRAILYLLDTELLTGVFNLTAPNPVRNREFVRELGKALGRPVWVPMPALGVRAILGNEASALLTEGLAVKPDRLLKSGFEFDYPALAEAMSTALSAF